MRFFKFSTIFKLTMLLSICMIIGCDLVDLKVTKIVLSQDYGNLLPRVTRNFKYYKKGVNDPNAKDYNILALYAVQKRKIAIRSHSVNQMVCYIYDEAIDNGADAIIVESISTTSNCCGNPRTSPTVHVKLIRFKGILPKI